MSRKNEHRSTQENDVFSRRHLLRAVVHLMGSLDLSSVLQEFVDQACKMTGAQYGALSILDNRGKSTNYFHYGLTDETAAACDSSPVLHHVLRHIPADKTIILNDVEGTTGALTRRLAADAHTYIPVGFKQDGTNKDTSSPAPDNTEHGSALPHLDPHADDDIEGLPPVTSFLGTPLRLHEQVYGRLYLCNKEGGFTNTDVEDVEGIAAIASIAVENSYLYLQARNREKWMRASQKLTTLLLEGQDEEEALSLIINTVRDVAEADTAIMILPSVGETWAAEIVEGAYADELLGCIFPKDGRALTVLREGRGLVVDALNRSPTLRIPQLGFFGPALYAPLMARGDGIGVLVLLRLPSREEFNADELAQAESLASQAALALELAGAQHAEDVAALFDERSRIGQDLHDLAIQQLFATGMELDRIKEMIGDGEAGVQQMMDGLDKALAAVDDSVRQIRMIVHNLREPDRSVELVERLRREASLARTSLGFAPSFVIMHNGRTFTHDDMLGASDVVHDIENQVNHDLADDVVAVVREALSNTARHAHASSVSVEVDIAINPDEQSAFQEPHVIVKVNDDGRGIDPQQTRRSGINNLAARARRHHGWTELTSNASGTSLFWCALLDHQS